MPLPVAPEDQRVHRDIVHSQTHGRRQHPFVGAYLHAPFHQFVRNSGIEQPDGHGFSAFREQVQLHFGVAGGRSREHGADESRCEIRQEFHGGDGGLSQNVERLAVRVRFE